MPGRKGQDISNLTPKAQQKILRKREQNRKAAKKSRRRRTQLIHNLEKNCAVEEQKKQDLEKERDSLQSQIEGFELLLALHLASSTCENQKISEDLQPSTVSADDGTNNQSTHESEGWGQGETLSIYGIFGDAGGGMLLEENTALQAKHQDSDAALGASTFDLATIVSYSKKFLL